METCPSLGCTANAVGADGDVNGFTVNGALATPVPPAVIAEIRN